MFTPPLLRRGAYTKPPGTPTVIPGKAPRGLLYCFPFADPQLTEVRTGLRISSRGSASGLVNTQFGPGLKPDSGSATAVVQYLLPAAWGTTQPCSIEMWFTEPAAIGGSVVQVNIGGLGGDYGLGFVGDRTAYINNQAVDATVSGSTVLNKLTQWVLTWTGSILTMYANVVASTGQSTGSLDTGETHIVFGDSNFGTWTGVNLLTNVANVAWTPGEILSRFQNPYGFLSFPQDKVYALLSAGAVPAAGGPVTGTLNLTQANQTISAAGNVPVVGTLNLTQANETLSAAGGPTVAGTLAVTQANQTLSATGTVPSAGITGTLAITQDNQTLGAAGTILVAGTLAVTQANQTLSATGAVTVGGTLNFTQANQTLAALGAVLVSGALSATQANQTLSSAGTVTVTGALNLTQANQTLAATGTVPLPAITGTLVLTELPDTLMAHGTVPGGGGSVGDRLQLGFTNFNVATLMQRHA